MKILKRIAVALLTVAALFVALNLTLYFTSTPDRGRIDEAVAYAAANGMRTDVVVLCDFARHSGTPRFWIYDAANDRVLYRTLCSHGNGPGNTASQPVFSNTPKTSCSCLGMFRIERFNMMRRERPSLQIEGLEESNNNALRREILIHTGKVPCRFPFGIFPFYIPLSNDSQGCFTSNYGTLVELIDMVAHSEQKYLLYAYY